LAASDVYIYSGGRDLHAEKLSWPPSLTAKRIWVFKNSAWCFLDE
jgi:hypothetical protein